MTKTTNRTRHSTVAAILGLSSLSLAACVGPPANQLAQQSGMIEATEAECPVDPDESITGNVRLGWQAIPNGDLIVQHLGWLEACMPNATVEWQRYDAGGDIIQAFGSGSVDISLSGSAPTARALSQPLNIDVVVPWVFDIIGEAESLVVKDPEIQSLEDLRGRTIAVPAGSTTHYSLLSALDQAGMSPQDVTVMFLAPDRMLGGWQSDELDAAWVWDPTLTELMEDGHVILSSADTAEGGAPTFDLAIAARLFAESNPEFMRMWATLQDRASQMINDDPAAAAEIVAIPLGLAPEMVQQQFDGYLYPVASEQVGEDLLGGKVGQDLLDTAVFLNDQQEISGLNPETTYFDAPVNTYLMEE